LAVPVVEVDGLGMGLDLFVWRETQRESSRYVNKMTEQEQLTNWQLQMVRHRKKMTERGVLMNWIPQRERLVRMWKESNQARVTHELRTTDGGTCQDIERKQPSQYPRRRDMSGHE